jgi:hypothetical protein
MAREKFSQPVLNATCGDNGEQNRLGRGQNQEHLFAGGGILASALKIACCTHFSSFRVSPQGT